ncbi:hypothetical protein RhiirA4_456318 [Rhizophagus irregularis]|uniref:Uncharacterized protein n=1 Tax=Rhizophagus irregularis TaxID=588596 RepID=A0A2I1G790_9GLOM|nr:hypothetical protein RhiirA4_456318 [Rhizophagus irregularis]
MVSFEATFGAFDLRNEREILLTFPIFFFCRTFGALDLEFRNEPSAYSILEENEMKFENEDFRLDTNFCQPRLQNVLDSGWLWVSGVQVTGNLYRPVFDFGEMAAKMDQFQSV